MTLSTSRVLSTVSKSGFRTPAAPTRASTAVPPRAGFGTVATGWHPTSANNPAAAAAVSSRLLMRGHPDIGKRADQESDHEHPRGPVDLALQAATGTIPAAAAIAASADRASEARGFRRLDEHAAHEEEREGRFCDDKKVPDVSHETG